MAKQLQRTIIVTIIETWTLTWAEPGERTKGMRMDEVSADFTPLHPYYWSPSRAVETVIVSSSRSTTVLPEPLAND
jgi:hypothetical protein